MPLPHPLPPIASIPIGLGRPPQSLGRSQCAPGWPIHGESQSLRKCLGRGSDVQRTIYSRVVGCRSSDVSGQ
jgi:hypothetical protein